MASAAAPNATTISETAVRLSISFCDAVALARVACASKWLSAVVHDIICGREDLLIPAAISLAVAHGGQQVQALNWLLNKVPNSPAVLQRVADRVLDIPCVDGKTASALTMRGLLFSWHDVVAAASRRVLGVEVWVGVGAVKDGCPPLASIISKQVLQVRVLSACHMGAPPSSQYTAGSAGWHDTRRNCCAFKPPSIWLRATKVLAPICKHVICCLGPAVVTYKLLATSSILCGSQILVSCHVCTDM